MTAAGAWRSARRWARLLPTQKERSCRSGCRGADQRGSRPSSKYRAGDGLVDTLAGFVLNIDARIHEEFVERNALLGDPACIVLIRREAAKGTPARRVCSRRSMAAPGERGTRDGDRGRPRRRVAGAAVVAALVEHDLRVRLGHGHLGTWATATWTGMPQTAATVLGAVVMDCRVLAQRATRNGLTPQGNADVATALRGVAPVGGAAGYTAGDLMAMRAQRFAE